MPVIDKKYNLLKLNKVKIYAYHILIVVIKMLFLLSQII